MEITELIRRMNWYLKNVQKAKALKFTMKQQGTGYVGLTELEIWTSTNGYTSNSTAELSDLKVNGTAVAGFAAGNWMVIP